MDARTKRTMTPTAESDHRDNISRYVTPSPSMLQSPTQSSVPQAFYTTLALTEPDALPERFSFLAEGEIFGTVHKTYTPKAGSYHRCRLNPCLNTRFSRISGLIRHINSVHSASHLYKCPYEGCPYTTSRNDALQQHIGRMHGVEAQENVFPEDIEGEDCNMESFEP